MQPLNRIATEILRTVKVSAVQCLVLVWAELCFLARRWMAQGTLVFLAIVGAILIWCLVVIYEDAVFPKQPVRKAGARCLTVVVASIDWLVAHRLDSSSFHHVAATSRDTWIGLGIALFVVVISLVPQKDKD